MNIKRTTVISVMVDENTELKVGDKVMFIANGVCMAGLFDGVTKRGALQFHNTINEKEVSFCVMPQSVETIEVIANE